MGGIGLGGVLLAVVMVAGIVAVVLLLAPLVRRPARDALSSAETFEQTPLSTVESLLPPTARTVEDRLAAVEVLHAGGAITDAERDEARVRIITSP